MGTRKGDDLGLTMPKADDEDLGPVAGLSLRVRLEDGASFEAVGPPDAVQQALQLFYNDRGEPQQAMVAPLAADSTAVTPAQSKTTGNGGVRTPGRLGRERKAEWDTALGRRLWDNGKTTAEIAMVCGATVRAVRQHARRAGWPGAQ